MRNGRLGVLSIAALFFLLTPVIAMDSEAHLRGASATMAFADVNGQLAGMAFEETGLDGATFRLNATRGRLVIDEESNDVWVNQVGLTSANHLQNQTTLTAALASGFQLGENHRILVLPLTTDSTFSSSVAQATLCPTAVAPISHAPRASVTRPAIVFNTTDSLQFSAAEGAGNLTIFAPFTLVVWETSFTLQANGTTQEIHTGATTEPFTPAAGQAGRHVQREAYFEVEEGQLTASVSGTTFVRRLTVATEASIELSEPQGVLPIKHSQIPPNSERLTMVGPLAATLTAVDGEVAVAFSREPSQVVLDGKVFVPQPPPSHMRAASAATWFLGMAGACGLLFMRQRKRRRLAEMRRLLARRDFDGALVHARQLAGRNEEACLVQATCLIQQGHYAQAKQALQSRSLWSQPSRPLQFYLLASAAGGEGDRATATDMLVRCIIEAPAYAAEAMANPLLSGVVKEAVAHRSPLGSESYA